MAEPMNKHAVDTIRDLLALVEQKNEEIASLKKHADRWHFVVNQDDIWFSRVTDKVDDNYGKVGLRMKYADHDTIYANTYREAVDEAMEKSKL